MSFASVSSFMDALRRVPLLEPEQLAELARQPAGTFADPRPWPANWCAAIG